MPVAHNNTKRAIFRVKERMRMGAKLMNMNSLDGGKKWYCVPGREVDEQIALQVIAEPDVFPCNDGLFPGVSQTYQLGSNMP
jgi:hypothetical protein